MQSRVRLSLAAVAAATLLFGVAAAQPYPSRPVRIVVGFQAGGGTDIAARVIAHKLADALGVTFIVDNRPGAAGNIGADIVAKANADGYTILMANSTIAIPSLSVKLPFNVKNDFAPVSNIALGPSVLLVNPSLPVTDLKGLVALAKAKPRTLIYGSGGVGNVTHLAMELLMSMTGIEMTHIPYKGAAPSVVGLLSGEVQLLFAGIPGVLAQISAGKVRALGVSISQRSPALPNVPTIAEAGLPGYYAASWYGLLLPAGTPRGVIGTLSQEIIAIMKVPDVREKMLAQGQTPIVNTPEEFVANYRADFPKWDALIRASGAKVE